MSIKPTNIPKCHLRKSADSAGNISRHCKLGELTENIRTFALPFESQTYTFKMQYKYDSYNRIQEMTYPDGEVVRYGYNRGGMLRRMDGDKNGVSSEYILDIRYNKFELRDSISYGNGTKCSYTYDSLLRLSRLRSYEGHDSLMQDIVYTYDSIGNILGIQNTAAALHDSMGGIYNNRYTYDDLYRLSKADCRGTIVEMTYHNNGRIHRKTVKRPYETQGNRQGRTAYIVTPYEYMYNIVQPNTLKGVRSYNYQGGSHDQIVEAGYMFRWDSCGNMVAHEEPGGVFARTMIWTEDNRLLLAADNSHLSLYLYDASGERTYKLTGDYNLQNTNGVWFQHYTLTRPTLYTSPYLVATQQGYTKHYYAGNERIASKIGGGGLSDMNNWTGHCLGNSVWDEDLEQVCDGHRLLPYLPSDILAGLYDWQDSVQPETDCYFYHPDHLGSASWVTDANGNVVQHLEYLPWGEDLVDQKLNGFDGVRYTFSAKEKDTETGYSYFGSRYYNSDLSAWLSVDPMSDKYPSLSPYVYCADNPMKLVDPDGEECDDPPAIKKVNNSNKNHLSKTSYGETSGIYPIKDVNNPSQSDCYHPDKWDPDKTQELLKARAAIHLIGTTRNKTVRNAVCPTNTSLQKILAAYHLTDNFPEVDDVIANDEEVKYFYLSPQKNVKTPSINSDFYDQKCVKTYGPFYNVGGGDVLKGVVYIHFYKAISKKKQSTAPNKSK